MLEHESDRELIRLDIFVLFSCIRVAKYLLMIV
jgi:hypothetical protein